MSTAFLTAINRVLGIEGGYVNNSVEYVNDAFKKSYSQRGRGYAARAICKGFINLRSPLECPVIFLLGYGMWTRCVCERAVQRALHQVTHGKAHASSASCQETGRFVCNMPCKDGRERRMGDVSKALPSNSMRGDQGHSDPCVWQCVRVLWASVSATCIRLSPYSNKRGLPEQSYRQRIGGSNCRGIIKMYPFMRELSPIGAR